MKNYYLISKKGQYPDPEDPPKPPPGDKFAWK
jgi:hypothetical protein